MTGRLSDIRSRLVLAAASAAVALGFAGPAHAIPLVVGNSVTTSGGITYFLNDCAFNTTVICGSTGFSGAFNAEGTQGIKITGPGPSFGPLLTALAGESMDLSLEFIVTGSNLKEITLGMGGMVGTGGAITISEHVYDGVTIDSLFTLSLNTPSTSITDLSDSTGTLTTSSALILDKDIFLTGPGEITYVTQRAGSHRVPEPSGLSLLLVAGGIVLALRRREAAIRLLRRSIA